jgi:hypothetical protein
MRERLAGWSQIQQLQNRARSDDDRWYSNFQHSLLDGLNQRIQPADPLEEEMTYHLALLGSQPRLNM